MESTGLEPMVGFPSSAIHVVTSTPDRLEILDPPRYWTGAIALIIGMGFLWFFTTRKRDASLTLNWAQIAIAIGMILAGLILITGSGRIVLSRSSNTLIIERQYIGIHLFPVQIRLSDIRNVTVESRSGPRRKIVLILQSGRPISVGTFTGQRGHYESAKAINEFLGAQRTP